MNFLMSSLPSGVVKSKRSIWRLKTITDFFWAIVNFIGVFFATMFSVMMTLFSSVHIWLTSGNIK